jgi:hypothetical protein
MDYCVRIIVFLAGVWGRGETGPQNPGELNRFGIPVHCSGYQLILAPSTFSDTHHPPTPPLPTLMQFSTSHLRVEGLLRLFQHFRL